MKWKVEFSSDGGGGFNIIVDGIKVGTICSSPERYVRLGSDIVARFKHSKNRLEAAKSFCMATLSVVSIAQVKMIFT